MAATEDAVRQDALAQLHAGQDALADGRIERAAEALVLAETLFRQIGDKPHTAESRASLAEVQRQNGALEQASASYERAIALYHETDQPAREAGALLQLGHLERQRGQLQQAWQRYYLASQLFVKSGNAHGQANATLALGHVARLRGQTEKAEEAYTRALDFAAQAKDTFGEADAARGLGDILAASGHYDEAGKRYDQALAIYRKAQDRFGEVDTLIGAGRLALDANNLDDAATRFGDAIALAAPIDYGLGNADGVLGLGEVALRAGRLDQALANGTQAESAYDQAGSPFGQAEANRLLGAVQLRRGQLAQAVTLFDRSSRAFAMVQARVPYVRSVLGSAEAHRRAGQPRKAEDLFGEARTVGDEVEQPTLVATAILGLGRLARARGRSEEAQRLLDEAIQRDASLHLGFEEALATLERAELALSTAHFDAAATLMARGRDTAAMVRQENERAGVRATAATIASALALALGQTEQARTAARQATEYADAADDETLRIEARLATAEVTLAEENYAGAVAAFNAALDLARSREALVAEGLAQTGLARVLLQRGLAAEAAVSCAEVMPRLRPTDDAAALIRLALTLGAARRLLEDRSLAREAFTQAERLARSSGARLDEVRALHGLGTVALDADDTAEALTRLDAALKLVEAIGTEIGDADTRASFFDTQAEVSADAIVAAARATQPERATELAHAYTRTAGPRGRAAVVQRLREEEQALPLGGANVSAGEAERDKATGRILAQARSALSK